MVTIKKCLKQKIISESEPSESTCWIGRITQQIYKTWDKERTHSDRVDIAHNEQVSL